VRELRSIRTREASGSTRAKPQNLARADLAGEAPAEILQMHRAFKEKAAPARAAKADLSAGRVPEVDRAQAEVDADPGWARAPAAALNPAVGDRADQAHMSGRLRAAGEWKMTPAQRAAGAMPPQISAAAVPRAETRVPWRWKPA